MNKFLLFLSISLVISCSEKQKKSPYIYFTGEIVNPKNGNDSVVLYKGEDKICVSKLDENNRFSFSLDSTAQEGLYHFGYSPEVQYIYLEKGDSLLSRVNTIDFDESLVFEGTGQEINNFLLEMFLAHEDEQENFIEELYTLNPEEFSKKVDSLNTIKMNLLNDLFDNKPISEKAIAIAKTGIDYTTYLYKERYPFKHKKATKEDRFKELPNDFYNYRKKVTYNNPDYTYVSPYYNFMKEHFRGMSYLSCIKVCDIKGGYYKNLLHFNEHQLKLIDSTIDDKSLKDNLTRNIALNYLLISSNNNANSTIFIEKFREIAKDNKHIGEIDTLYQNIKRLQPNMPLPNIMINDFYGEKISLSEISNSKKNVVFYFWIGEYKNHFKYMIDRVKKLNSSAKNKYTYIGINLRTDEKKWKDIIIANKLNKENQFRASNIKEINNTLIINGRINKAIITDNGKVVNAFSNMYSSF